MKKFFVRHWSMMLMGSLHVVILSTLVRDEATGFCALSGVCVGVVACWIFFDSVLFEPVMTNWNETLDAWKRANDEILKL